MTKPFDFEAWLATTEREVRREGSQVRAVAVKRRFAASIERVWAAWLDGWTALVVAGEARLGETVTLDLGQPERTRAHILACEPPRHLATTWVYGAAEPAQPDEVAVRLSPDGDGTWLELVHRSVNGTPWAAGVGAGWEAGLLIFAARLDGLDPSMLATAEWFPRLDALWTDYVAA